jgi:urate oxidase
MVTLGPNQYGKAEVRLLRVNRSSLNHSSAGHELRDLSVSVALSGELTASHLTGDNSAVLTTDAQKNTVFAFAAEHGVAEIEDFALLLAEHFVASQEAISVARVSIEEYAWERLGDHSFARSAREVRTTTVIYDTARHDTGEPLVVSGLKDLILLNSAGSEFWGFAKDRYTTLAETTDRILATAVNAQWRHDQQDGSAQVSWGESYATARDLLMSAFAQTRSYSLQQTLYAMGTRVIEGLPDIAEIRLSLPNKHHFEVDLSPFGMENKGEVFYASDRPYGLIEGTVLRDGAEAELGGPA